MRVPARWRYYLSEVLGGIALFALAACIPVGFVMGLYTNNGNWFLLCIPLILFLS